MQSRVHTYTSEGLRARVQIVDQCKIYQGTYHVAYDGGHLPEGRLPQGWRGYTDGAFKEMYECCADLIELPHEIHACESHVRHGYQMWERGRMFAGLKELHNALTRFDLDEQRDFMRRYPKLVDLINEWAIIEEVRTFPHGVRKRPLMRGQLRGQEHVKKYELEKVIVIGEEGASTRREEHIAYSENYHELLEMAAKLPLKGGRYLSEWYAILELDEHGEIVDHAYTMFADDELRKQDNRVFHRYARIGDCYRYVWKYAVKNSGATFIHGTIEEPFALYPNRYGHAWVEDNGMVYDWQTMVAGGGGKFAGKGWPKAVFYETFKPRDITKYTSREILHNTSKYYHVGPWT